MDLSLVQTVLTIIFGIVAVLSIIIAVRLARRKRPVWAYVTTKVIGLGSDAPPELQLVFNGKPVPEVYRTLIIFFNKGNETIRKDDVTDAIQMHIKGAELLRNAYPMIMSNMQTRLEIVPRSNDTFEIDFYYLDRNDGAVIEAIHTKLDDITCEGNIMGAGRPRYIGEFISRRPEHFIRRLIGNVIIVALPIVGIIWSFLGVEEISGEFVGLWIMIAVIWYAAIIPQLREFFHYAKFPRWSIRTV